jgi:hypothetical protein
VRYVNEISRVVSGGKPLRPRAELPSRRRAPSADCDVHPSPTVGGREAAAILRQFFVR